jgi:hypothetical protein
LHYLKRLPIVREVRPLSASDDRIVLRLDLSSGVESLQRLIQGGGALRERPAADASVLEFQLEP